jgi:hypothetical protein
MKKFTDCLVDGCFIEGWVKLRQGIAKSGLKGYFAKRSSLSQKLARRDVWPAKDRTAKAVQPGKHGLFEFVFVEHYLNPLISRRFL